jgi:phytanoyl-CoA hydroxylase
MADSATGFHSDFGGLWTDRTDALEEILRRQQEGLITDDQEYLLRFWVANGYVILEGAVDHRLCDQLALELKDIFTNGSHIAKYQPPDAPAGSSSPVPAGLSSERMRLVDMYGASLTAAKVLMAPAITDFLSLIFEEKPLCFQGLTFEQGSGQGLHQDTAYVVVDRPLELAATWVALEDIREGSGELMYVEGSHRLPDWRFGGDSKHWDPARHGDADHSEWTKWLVRKSEEMGLTKKLFRPKKGDVLVWAADLVHGGSPVADQSLSRRSIVGHYCPSRRQPHYFSYLVNRVKEPFLDGFFSSAYYDLNLTTFATQADFASQTSTSPPLNDWTGSPRRFGRFLNRRN